MADLSFRSQLQADRFTVKRILDLAAGGELRLPIFQRPLRWRRADHALLLDSLYRGYPVGTLLLWERGAPKATTTFGPVQFAAGEKSSAYWIVDGQQRITSIVGCLSAEAAGEGVPDGEFVSDAHHVREFAFYFDLQADKFVRPPRIPQPHLVPVGRLRDGVSVSMWAAEVGADADLHRRALAVGDRLRTYEIPAYILRAEDDNVLRVVFDRSNSSGKRMQASEIFEGLNRGLSPDEAPESLLERLEGVLYALDFGAVPARTLQKTLIFVAGFNPRDDLPEGLRAPGAARDWESRTAEALGRVVAFLRDEALIPHARTLPYDLPFIALARFFHRFPAPSERSVELLVRWIWRGIHAQTHMVTNQQLNPLFSILEGDDNDEDTVVTRLLLQVGSQPPAHFPPAASFNPRGMRTRTELVALYSYGPIHLETGLPLAPGEVFEHEGTSNYPTLPGLPPAVTRTSGARFLHPRPFEGFGPPDFAALLRNADDVTLASHGIPPEAFADVRAGRWAGVVEARQEALNGRTAELITRMARWGEDDDGPALSSLLDEDAVAEDR